MIQPGCDTTSSARWLAALVSNRALIRNDPTSSIRCTVNCAARLLKDAEFNLQVAWRPLRQKYGLPARFNYDQQTGEIITGGQQHG